ncbi:hypothetical protein I4U23_000056 [Adineta vaga]|nr:hypothetical protein I4U23_000056 [Adineta vaga]
MLVEESETQESTSSLIEASSLDNDFDTMGLESEDSDVEDADDELDSSLWSEIQPESDAEFIKDYGLAQKLTEDVMTQMKRYFALPLDVKMKCAVGDMSKGQVRGFLTYLRAECPDIGDQKDESHMEGFREIVYDGYYLTVKELAYQLAGAFALALKLPRRLFCSSLDKPLDKNRIGSLQHTDFGGFTLLQQSSDVVALQVQNIKNEWIDAKPIEGTFVVNIADTTQRWTNDQFISTLHRVINVSDKERYSIGFFFGPNYFTRVDCLPTCYDDKTNPKKYEPVLSGEFVLHRLKTCHLTDNDDRDIGRLPGVPKK